MTTKLSETERFDWLRLARTPGVGPITFSNLIDRFRSASEALGTLPDLSRKAGRKRAMTPPSPDAISQEIEATAKLGAQIVAACEADYPPLLRAIDPPPPVLTLLGDTTLAAKRTVAIVGARNASAAGRKIARDMAAELGQTGYVTVSGLARGIDGEVHAASLKTGTIAALAGGVDHIYPQQHDRLHAAIAAEGLIISERPLGARAVAKDFPRRNRIVTGCSLGVVVVEAAERSGSLISARTAGEQGREVMAIPGSPLDPRSAGANRLLRDGATLVRSSEDVIEVLDGLERRHFSEPPGAEFEPPTTYEPDADELARVREALTHIPISVDEIARAAGVPAGRCAAILTELELGGVAETLPGGLAMLAVLQE
ncbi:MAG: DNA-processing protein DprA [Pseudomonadota bacterium]